MESKLDPPSPDGPEEYPFPTLQSDRLTLRRLEEGDRDFLIALHTDPEVMRFVHFGPSTLEDARRFAVYDIESAPFYRLFHQWLLEVKRDRTPVGSVQVRKYRQTRRRTDRTDDFHIGYQLAPAYWGEGYATEGCSAVIDYAFGKVQLDRLVAYPRPENRRSQRVLEKLGFLQDGTCQDPANRQCPFFVLTRKQWLGRREPKQL